MRAKYFLSFILAFSLIFLLIGCSDTSHYEKCKTQSVRFLEKNEDKLIDFSENLISNGGGANEKYKSKYHCSYHEGAVRYVQIDIDARGMLGGQYWGIIYCPDNNFLPESDTIQIYDEKETTGEGNNIFIREKIKDNWYFYYDDYDGTVDISAEFITVFHSV